MHFKFISVDYYGNDFGGYVKTSSAAKCQLQCQENSQCKFFNWDRFVNNYHF